MDPTLRLVDRFEELLTRQHDQSPYDFKSIFQGEGFFARRASQRKLKLLKCVDEQLRAMLWPGEKVVFLSTGAPYAFWEAYLLGGAFYYLSLTALALTTERLVLIQINTRRVPQRLRSQILLTDIERIGRSAFGNSTIRLRSGKRYMLAYVPRRDRTRLTTLLTEVQPQAVKVSAEHGIEQLCPYCYAAVPGHPDACPACGGPLKSPRRAALLSLLFPGLGTIYLGYWRFGLFKVALGVLFWIGAWAPDREHPLPLAARAFGAVVVLGIVHGLASLTSYLLGRKGHYPSEAPGTRSQGVVAAGGAA